MDFNDLKNKYGTNKNENLSSANIDKNYVIETKPIDSVTNKEIRNETDIKKSSEKLDCEISGVFENKSIINDESKKKYDQSNTMPDYIDRRLYRRNNNMPGLWWIDLIGITVTIIILIYLLANWSDVTNTIILVFSQILAILGRLLIYAGIIICGVLLLRRLFRR